MRINKIKPSRKLLWSLISKVMRGNLVCSNGHFKAVCIFPIGNLILHNINVFVCNRLADEDAEVEDYYIK